MLRFPKSAVPENADFFLKQSVLGLTPLQAHLPVESKECKAGRHAVQFKGHYTPEFLSHDGQQGQYIVFMEYCRMMRTLPAMVEKCIQQTWIVRIN